MKTKALTVAAVVCAMAVGLLVADLSGGGRATAARGPVQASSADSTATAPGVATAPRPRAALGPRPGTAPIIPGPPPIAPPDPVEIERELAEEDARIAAAYDREVADADWASAATAALADGLDTLAAEAPFRTTALDCRRTMCRAELAGTSDGDAMAWAGLAIGANYGLGCATRIRLSPPAPDGAPQTATLYLPDCRRE